MSTTAEYGYGVRNPIAGGVDSPEMAAIITLTALGFLVLVRRGFRGIR